MQNASMREKEIWKRAENTGTRPHPRPLPPGEGRGEGLRQAPHSHLEFLELHSRRRRRFLVRGESRARAQAQEEFGRQVRRERAHGGIVFRHFLDVAVARDGDAVLRAFELRLEISIVLVRLELGIALDRHEQPRPRAGPVALRLLELLHHLRIAEILRLELYTRGLAARLNYLCQRILLEFRRAFDGLDEVGYQVGAPLILVLHLRPRRFDLFVEALQIVIAAAGQQQDDGEKGDAEAQGFFHMGESPRSVYRKAPEGSQAEQPQGINIIEEFARLVAASTSATLFPGAEG